MKHFLRSTSLLIGALVVSASLVAPASAATSPATKAQQALGSARSYKMTLQTTSTGAPSGPSASTTTITAVRSGGAIRLYAVSTTRTGKTVTTTEIVYGAKHTCMRTGGKGAWNCGLPPMTSLLGQATSLSAGMAPHTTWTPIGNKSVQGQDCAGYHINIGSTSLTSHGTIWINAASKRPVLEQATSVVGFGKGKAVKSASTIIWSNWNDPRLAIPAVPGA